MSIPMQAPARHANQIRVLTLDEIELVAGGKYFSRAYAAEWAAVGNTLMAVGAAGAGVGVATGQPEIVAASAIIGSIGGIVYIFANY